MDLLKKMIDEASEEDLKSLSQLFNLKNSESKKEIIDYIENTYLLENYHDDLLYVAKKLKITDVNKLKDNEIEEKINMHIFDNLMKSLNDDQKEQINIKLKEELDKINYKKEIISSTAILGSLIAGKMSGFGIYLIAATTLGAITNAVNVTLPFVVYTTLSRTIAFVIAPIGFTTIVGGCAFSFFKRKHEKNKLKKLLPLIVFISVIREKELMEKAIQGNKLELNN